MLNRTESKLIAVAIALVLLSFFFGCAHRKTVSQYDDSDRLDALPGAIMPSLQTVDESPIEVVARGYQDALALVDDGPMNEDILRRLAVLELRKAEQQQIDRADKAPEQLYKEAIATYHALLASQQYRSDNDKLLYPLAKAYELSGELDKALDIHSRLVDEFPESQYYSEVQFRRGELLFSKRDYRAAAKAYSAVVARDQRDAGLDGYEPTPYLINANYMWGWSDFKLGRYTQAMSPFIVVLDHHLGEADYAFDVDNGEHDNAQSSANDSLLEDTFRVLALSFSYTDGAKTIEGLLDSVGERNYATRLYYELAELYLSKKRFVDSANVYASFIQRYPNSPSAPEFHQQKIEAYIAGRFPERVRNEKIAFAENYAVEGVYWNTASATTQMFIRDKLAEYIDELATYHHGLAQNSSEETEIKDRAHHYDRAAHWYQEWIRSFPASPLLPDKYFLLGETRYESQSFAQAVEAYEVAAYSFGDFAQANEAGYAALIAYDDLIRQAPSRSAIEEPAAKTEDTGGAQMVDSANGETLNQQRQQPSTKFDWQEKKIESALLFAENFTADSRRNGVLAQTIELLLSHRDYQRTIDVASLLLAGENLTQELLFTGWISTAHAHKAMLAYSDAETAYGNALQVLAANSVTPLYAEFYQKTLDNYAASIYQQGEAAHQTGDKALAAATFLRVVEAAPQSSIRVTAQHDASVLLMETAQWETAIQVITDFQQRFPAHEANESAAARLLKAHESLGNWSQAAAQSLIIAKNDDDPEARRQALFNAAELYEKGRDESQAIVIYRDYAHGYKDPLADRMEAQYKLVALYEKTRQPGKRMFWVKQLMTTHDAATSKTDRSTYLAAFASAELASGDLGAYYATKLKTPLKQSLAKKRKAMEVVIASYEKTASYGVAEYTTLATQKMGEVYASFASELMASERPKNLSDLELEQYDILLEEQAYPFEEQAIDFHVVNLERGWQGTRTDAVKKSLSALQKLMPARYSKPEILPGYPK